MALRIFQVFEFWFIGPNITHHGTTHDFLEVCAQITENIGDPQVTGDFVAALMDERKSSLPFLRVVDWKFEYILTDDRTIKLHKLI